jgi:hypothetical protein
MTFIFGNPSRNLNALGTRPQARATVFSGLIYGPDINLSPASTQQYYGMPLGPGDVRTVVITTLRQAGGTGSEILSTIPGPWVRTGGRPEV